MASKRRGQPIHGWLVIDKAAGMTSAAVVAAVRRLTRAAKAGHAGTLDPLATGVLPIALGEATKCMAFVMDARKTYEFTISWGSATETDDREGAVIARSDHRPSEADIRQALAGFIGEIEQVPPKYSAVKVAGRRAYDLARAGETPEIPTRRITVNRFDLIEIIDPHQARFSVACGKGAYMRALARDLAVELGTLGHIATLRRTRVGMFDEAAAISLDNLTELCNTSGRLEALLPVQTALADIPALALTGPQASRMRCGDAVQVLHVNDGLVCAMNGTVPIALAKVDAGRVQPVRVFNL